MAVTSNDGEPDPEPATAILTVYWDTRSGWAWLAHGHGATSRFAGFGRFADPNPTAVLTLLNAHGWTVTHHHKSDTLMIAVIHQPDH